MVDGFAPLLPGPLFLIGCGNMAGAMLKGWLDAGADPSEITVVRPSGRPRGQGGRGVTRLAGDRGPGVRGVRVLPALPEDEGPAIVLLGVKPQKLDEIAPRLAPVLAPETILVSILAGVEVAALRARFPAPRMVVRAMPNTPVALRKGVVGLHSDRSADEGARAVV